MIDRISVLIYRGQEAIGEWRARCPNGIDRAIREVCTKLKPEFQVRFLGDHGVLRLPPEFAHREFVITT